MRFLLKPLRVAVMVVKGFYRHECFTRATALTYVSLLSMIPLLAIAFAILSYYASENTNAIEKYLYTFFSPAGSLATKSGIANDKVNPFVQGIMVFVKNVNIKHFKIFGILFLFLSSISLISSIEYSFNRIWGIKKGRSPIRKAGSYSIILVALPFFIAISISLSTSYQLFAMTTTSEFENILFGFKGHFYIVDFMINVSSFAVHNLGVALSHLLQFLFAWALFSLLYFYLPYTKVKFYFSLKGGLCTAVMFEVAKPLFTGYVKYFLVSSTINKLYGALSFIPVSFLWIYIVWTIILLGAELTYAFQNVKIYQSEIRINKMNQRSKDLIILKMVKEILVQQKWGLFFTVDGLSNRFNVPFYFVDDAITRLVEGGVLTENANADQIKILDENITPCQIIQTLYNVGKNDTLELKHISLELEEQMKDWESTFASQPSRFEI